MANEPRETKGYILAEALYGHIAPVAESAGSTRPFFGGVSGRPGLTSIGQ